MGTVETMMMQTCVLLALCAAAQAAMPWTASLTKLNSAEFTSLASIGMTSSEWNQPTGGTSFPSSGVIQTNQGGYYVDTKETFHRPVDMSVELYQTSGSNECGVVALFPQNTNRHSGYNAGVGWWAHYFGAGVDGSITNYGTDGGATSGWQTVRINAAADGKVYYYLGGSLKYKATKPVAIPHTNRSTDAAPHYARSLSRPLYASDDCTHLCVDKLPLLWLPQSL